MHLVLDLEVEVVVVSKLERRRMAFGNGEREWKLVLPFLDQVVLFAILFADLHGRTKLK